jgi:hypothetical protein
MDKAIAILGNYEEGIHSLVRNENWTQEAVLSQKRGIYLTSVNPH